MPCDWGSSFVSRHPIVANVLIITVISVLGIYVAYVATALFTKHGCSSEVPRVEGKSYTDAISILHDAGFRVDIRDSLYREDIKPGYVIEQFPKGKLMVKPGRKIFLYINAVHPKEVVLDDDNHPTDYAMKGISPRSAMARLEELGFKNIRVVKVLGSYDRVVKVLANGKIVRKTEKIPINASIVLEISDGRLDQVKDSLQRLEYMRNYKETAPVTEDPDYSDPEYSDPDVMPEVM